MKKCAPIGPLLSWRAWSSCATTTSGGSPVTDTMPSPPASATAAARRGLAQPPIGACWIGTVQPTRSVKRVLSIVGLRSPDTRFARHSIHVRYPSLVLLGQEHPHSAAALY